MKRKILRFLSKIKRSKVFKIFFCCFLVLTVFLSSFVTSFADSVQYTLSGYRLFERDLDLDSRAPDLIYITSTSQAALRNVTFVSNGTTFVGYTLADSSLSGPSIYNGVVVYTSSGGWVADEYRTVNFGPSQLVSFETYSFFNSYSNSYRPIDFVYGVRLFNSSLDLTLPGFNGETLSFNALEYVTGGSGYYTVPFVSNSTDFVGLNFFDSSFIGPDTVVGNTVYLSGFGWVDDVYRRVDFGNGYAADLELANWIYANSVAVESGSYDDGYYLGLADGFNQGYDEGFDDGFSDGYTEGSETGYDNGYAVGLRDGLTSTESGNLGENVIGSTLAAPFEMLNNFTLFVAPNGTPITLGYVLYGLIALMLFIGFLKLFAGG